MEVIDAMAVKLREEYVREELGLEMAEATETAFMDGELEGLGREEFARTLTETMRAVGHDGHMRVFSGPVQPGKVTNKWRPREPVNHGFASVEVLPGNVGYLELQSFSVGCTKLAGRARDARRGGCG